MIAPALPGVVPRPIMAFPPRPMIAQPVPGIMQAIDPPVLEENNVVDFLIARPFHSVEHIRFHINELRNYKNIHIFADFVNLKLGLRTRKKDIDYFTSIVNLLNVQYANNLANNGIHV